MTVNPPNTMTETAVERSPTEAQLHRALVEVAACAGNTHQAARNLKQDENARAFDQKTLWRWSRRQHVEKYERIRQEALPRITAQAAEQHMMLAQYQTAIAAEAADRIKERLPKMEDRDLINAMGKADIGSGIHTEKAQLLSGQPTHRADRSVEELLRGLASKGVQLGEKREEADGSVVERVAVLPGSED